VFVCAHLGGGAGGAWVQKRAAAQDPTGRIAQLVERVAALEGQVQEKEALEVELRQQLTRLQRQAESHMVRASIAPEAKGALVYCT